jgi:hypothetical protein
MIRHLRECMLDFLAELGGAASEKEVRRYLGEIGLGTTSALAFIEHECGSLSAFVEEHAAGELLLRRMIGRNVLQLRGASALALEEARRGNRSRRGAEGGDGDADADVDYGEAVLAAQSMLFPSAEDEQPTPSSPQSVRGPGSTDDSGPAAKIANASDSADRAGKYASNVLGDAR